jgi:hypothetical protein
MPLPIVFKTFVSGNKGFMAALKLKCYVTGWSENVPGKNQRDPDVGAPLFDRMQISFQVKRQEESSRPDQKQS